MLRVTTGVDRDNTITACCRLSFWRYDDCPTADPRSLANSDSAALRNILRDKGYRNIFVRLIVVPNHDLLADGHIHVLSEFGPWRI